MAVLPAEGSYRHCPCHTVTPSVVQYEAVSEERHICIFIA